MSEKLGAVLIAEIGSLMTRVTLVDTVEGETRLIGQAEAPTSAEPPYNDVFIGVLEATMQIASLTGRELLQDGRLIKPQNHERDGVNYLVATTSAAGNLELIITAIARDISAHSALRASRCTYTNVLKLVTLDDATLNTELQRTTSWVGRQVETMLALRPDAIILAGGLEGGARNVLYRLARIVGFAVGHVLSDRSQQRRSNYSGAVIFAGNSAARQGVQRALAERAETIVVDNLRPALEEESLEATRRELARLYDRQIMTRLPGMSTLQNLCSASVTTTCGAAGLMTRFLAEKYQRHVLTLDIGSTSSSSLLAGGGRFTPAVLGVCGTGYGIMAVVQARGLKNIARWLPFPIEEQELLHRLLNKQLRPHIIPTSREEVLIEHALTREALTMVLEALTDEHPEPAYDLVVAAGGVLAHTTAHPGLAALTVLDALQPTSEKSESALELHVDALGLLSACGALVKLDSDAAVTLCERDVLRNMPLATCVVALGGGKPGTLAVEAELRDNRGIVKRVSVNHGQIARLPLMQGWRGTLTLRPASGVRIGENAPGEEIPSNTAAISGSALGIVIDARGRPLRLPEDDMQRYAVLWQWLVALGAAQGPQPYVDVEVDAPPVTDTQQEAADQPKPRKRSLFSSRPAKQEEAAEAAPVLPDLPPLEPEPVALEAEAEKPRKRSRLFGGLGKKEPATASSEPFPPEAPPAQDEAFDLPDLAAIAETPPAEPPAPQGQRVSLEDLAETPPAELPAPQGRRVSLEDLAREEKTSQSPSRSSPEAEQLQNDLASFRDADEKPRKRGLFGRKK